MNILKDMKPPRLVYKTVRNKKIVVLHDVEKKSFHQIGLTFHINQSIAYRVYWGEKIRSGTRKGIPKGMKKYYNNLLTQK